MKTTCVGIYVLNTERRPVVLSNFTKMPNFFAVSRSNTTRCKKMAQLMTTPQLLNPILYGLLGQRILQGGWAKMPLPYLKPKVMGASNLACWLVFTKIFQKTGFELRTL